MSLNYKEKAIVLEDSIADYEKGMKVLDYCKRQLKQAEDKVNQILLDADQDPLPSQKPPRLQPLDHSPLDLEDLTRLHFLCLTQDNLILLD